MTRPSPHPELPSADEIRRKGEALGLFAGLDAEALARELAQDPGEGPLAGMLVGLKANIACRGALWTAGLAHRDALRATSDAHVTASLRRAGARLLPGLNMDAAALGGTTENPHFGPAHNPRAPGHSAGGSSGGSAAAVAAGLVPAALGTDTLGSVRIPAAYCGLVGLKPTMGLVGRTGIVPLAPSLDVAGVLCVDAAHAWLILQAIAGQDPGDPGSEASPSPLRGPLSRTAASGLRVGVPSASGSVAVEACVSLAMERAAEALRAAGAEVSPVEMPGWEPAILRKATFLLLEREGAEAFAAELAEGGTLPPSVQALLAYGRDAPAEKLAQAQAIIRTAREAAGRALGAANVLLMPTVPTRAPRLGAPPAANQADFTALANATGLPAISIPVPLPGGGLPVAVQIVGPRWSEAVLLGLAATLEEGFAG